jgi:hypothetical protein
MINNVCLNIFLNLDLLITMKNTIAIILMIILASSCNKSEFSLSGKREKKFVSKFLDYMNHSSGPETRKMMNFISPKYLMEHNIDKTKYSVDFYTIWGYSIESDENKGFVTAIIQGKNGSWAHLLTFKLSKEDGKLYIIPSKYNNQFISPWWKCKTDIENYVPIKNEDADSNIIYR